MVCLKSFKTAFVRHVVKLINICMNSKADFQSYIVRVAAVLGNHNEEQTASLGTGRGWGRGARSRARGRGGSQRGQWQPEV